MTDSQPVNLDTTCTDTAEKNLDKSSVKNTNKMLDKNAETLEYTEEAQEVFNRHYDYFYEMIEKFKKL